MPRAMNRGRCRHGRFIAAAVLALVAHRAAPAADAPAAPPSGQAEAHDRPARVRLASPSPGATVDELFAYIAAIADPALEPDSRGRLRFHRRKVAALTTTAADMILIQVPESDPRHARAAALKQAAETAAEPAHEAVDAGAQRRLSLPGRPIELEGTLVDGAAFDPASLAGKVVLVDFWATWCGPCVAEIPRVRELYDRYHDRGFEVVGIGLDEDRDTLAEFIADREIPWPVIHDARPAGGGRALLADRYGISGIPTMILVGRNGLVVSIDARSRRLVDLLAEQFPDP